MAHLQRQIPKPIFPSYQGNVLAVQSINPEPPSQLQPKVTSPWMDHQIMCTIVTQHGLLLLCGVSFLCLWNPATRYFRDIPFPTPTSNPSTWLYGFGFDESIDDYKVVWADSRTSASVLALKANTWSRVGDIPYDNSYCTDHCILQGVLHWRTDVGVICFHIKEETFQDFWLPAHIKSEMCSLSVIKDQICVAGEIYNRGFTVYLMNDYHAKPSLDNWSLWFSIENPDFQFVKPMMLTEDHHLMMLVERDKYELIVYNLEDNIAGATMCEEDVSESVAMYVESILEI